MTLELPEDFFSPKSGYTEKAFRLDTAVLLYQRKVANLARAAKIAGISESEFEQILQERGLLLQADSTDETQLTANERFLKYAPTDHPLRAVVKPMRTHIALEQLIKEQNYTGTDWDALHEIAHRMAIKEPLELLLNQLKA